MWKWQWVYPRREIRHAGRTSQGMGNWMPDYVNNEERDHWIWEGPIRVGEY
jgi:hypothetical protein